MGNDEVFRQLHRNPFRHQPFHFLRWRHWDQARIILLTAKIIRARLLCHSSLALTLVAFLNLTFSRARRKRTAGHVRGRTNPASARAVFP
jgi:hypothetical protein